VRIERQVEEMKLHAVATGGPPEGQYGREVGEMGGEDKAPRSGPRRAPGGSVRIGRISLLGD
jgi:hypothetical protein